MTTISIYEAKTNLSKLVKRAQAGETIYIGSYGNPQAVLTPLPKKPKIQIGVWKHMAIKDAYIYEDLVNPDLELAALMEADDPLLHL